MQEIKILFALKAEANSLINHSPLRFSKVNKRRFEAIYKEKKITLIISGVGREQTERTLTSLSPTSESLIIKAGSCALLPPELELFTPYLPSFVTDGSRQIELSPPEMGGFAATPQGAFTVTKPLTDSNLHPVILAKEAAFVEMELFYIMNHFRDHHHKLALLCGTDRGDGSAFKDFFTNIKRVSESLKDALLKLIDGM